MINISAILSKYGHMEGLFIRDDVVVKWPYSEPEPSNDELVKLSEDYVEAIKYKELRAKAYPSIIDQMEMLYDKGLVGWKAEIKKVKDKYPKPEEV